MANKSSDSAQLEKEKLEWIQTFEQLDKFRVEDKKDLRTKMYAKIKQNPFVPIGMLATTAALSMGLWSMKNGNKRRSQIMMRTRILCQGFTVVALLVGIIVAGNAKPKGT